MARKSKVFSFDLTFKLCLCYDKSGNSEPNTIVPYKGRVVSILNWRKRVKAILADYFSLSVT